MAIVPASRPQWNRSRIEDLLTAASVPETVALVGVRGYYRDSMGAVGRNDRGIYDDAIFLVSPHAFVSYNANTDPSIYRRRIATLAPGLYRYRIGIHGLSKPKAQQYKALVQAAPVTVARDQAQAESGYFGINIHRGSRTSTSSLGCQTIYPTQWAAFIASVESELKRVAQKTIPYLLIEAQG